MVSKNRAGTEINDDSEKDILPFGSKQDVIITGRGITVDVCDVANPTDPSRVWIEAINIWPDVGTCLRSPSHVAHRSRETLTEFSFGKGPREAGHAPGPLRTRHSLGVRPNRFRNARAK